MINSGFTGKKVLSCVLLAVIYLSACKKDKLKGDDEELAGTWKWVYTDGGINGNGPQFDANFNRTLVILKKGKYKYANDSKKLGHGILNKKDGIYQFINRELSSDDDLNGQKIIRHHGDTIDIAVGTCCDMFVTYYVKQK